MLRKSLVALVAAAALITLSVQEASARPGGRGGGGGFHGGGFHGGGFRGGGHGFSRGFGGGPRMHMGGGGYRGGFARGGWGHRGFVHRGFGPRFGYGYRPFRPYGFRPYFAPTFYAAPYAYYGGSCFRWRRVWTPYGVQLRRVWVCGRRW
jgi:hypothetical protein